MTIGHSQELSPLRRLLRSFLEREMAGARVEELGPSRACNSDLQERGLLTLNSCLENVGIAAQTERYCDG